MAAALILPPDPDRSCSEDSSRTAASYRRRDLACDHGLTIWDSVVLAASAEAECRLLLSEDLQEGFTWRGVTVTNPFAPTLHPLLAALPTALEE